jgi:hypothetical protein
LSLPMKGSTKRKCPGCSEFYLPDRRNLWHQCYCSKAACRKLSKAESQRRCLQKPDNQNYFRGPENNRRVQEWRKRNPGYWRKKNSTSQEPLQEVCTGQVAQNQEITRLTLLLESFSGSVLRKVTPAASPFSQPMCARYAGYGRQLS